MKCCKGQAYDQMFDARTAARELRRYERKGPTGATRRLLAAVQAALGDSSDFTHLDIGGGVGVLQHELSASGARQTTAVDASRHYLALLEQAARSQGYIDRQVRIEGDFVEVAEQVPEATVVTLDKVICCYPDMPALVGAAAGKATEVLAVVVPRDGTVGQATVGLMNGALKHVLRREFRAFVHAHADIDEVAAGQGLVLERAQAGLMWVVRIYRRSGPATPLAPPL